MPNYEYRCPTCFDIKDIHHSIVKNPSIKCDVCRNKMQRLIHPGGRPVFVGEGFNEHHTDTK